MPTLDWIGKKAVVNHHREVPFHILKEDESLSYGKKDSGNLIVEGDNLVALKALLPYYAGKVKCIYIDPPYNTGNEKWVYNDNVNSPEIKKWLGQVVGKESEDLSRHDKWLCMMYPRLQLLREFLSDDGVIFISLDDNEISTLHLLLNEIFGSSNFVANLPTIMNLKGNQDEFGFAGTHEYTVVYAKNKTYTKIGTFPIDEESIFKSWEEDESGYYKKGATLKRTGIDAPREKRPFGYYPILIDENKQVSTINEDEFKRIYNPIEKTFDDIYVDEIIKKYSEKFVVLLPIIESKKTSWRWQISKLRNESSEVIVLGDYPNFSLYKKQRPELGELPSKKPKSVFYKAEYSSGNGTKALKELIGENKFGNPKPPVLIKDLLQIGTDKDSLILDSFGGSGTTAQAVLELNKEDGGNRKFILTEMLPEVAEPITRERAKRVIDRDGLAESTGFKFAKLGEAMYTADGDINPNIKYADLARHVFFMATGTPLAYETTEFKTPLIGVSNGVAIYLLYNGILGDESVNGGNRLTQKILKELPKHDGVKIIYGTACGLSETMLRRHNIVFRQIPYSIFDK